MARKKQLPPQTEPPGPHDDHRGATRERLAKAVTIEEGRDERGQSTGVVTVRDGVIERMVRRRAISELQYIAAIRYRDHWEKGGLNAGASSCDPNRVHGVDYSSFGHMAKSEAQAHHRGEYRRAREMLGSIAAAIVEHVVCYCGTLESLGEALGWQSRARGIDAAQVYIAARLDELVNLWELKPPRSRTRAWSA